MIHKTRHPDPTCRRGFTLVELMVSIALVLIIVLGVNSVFKHASDAVGTGMAISETTRAFQSAYTTLRSDIEQDLTKTPGMLPLSGSNTVANRTPALVITSRQLTNWPVDATASTTATCNLDTLVFFAQGSFRRQTSSNLNEFFASMVPSANAFIWLGQLWLPTNNDPALTNSWYYAAPGPNTMTFPGYGNPANNPNNFYAKDWRLGRAVIGVQTPDPVSHQLLDYSGKAQLYVARALGAGSGSLSPFAVDSQTTVNGPCSDPRIQWSQCDLAGTDLFGVYRSIISNNAAPAPGNNDTTWGIDHFGYRFRANPYTPRPLTASTSAGQAAFAQSLPIFLNGCMSFKVDFAGDLDNNGTIDLTKDGTGIQWYGYPNGLPNTDPKCVNTVQALLGGAAPIYEHSYVDPVYGQSYYWAWSQYELGSQPVGNGNRNGGRPSLIRFTITLTDANGRLQNGMTQEMIFQVPQTN